MPHYHEKLLKLNWNHYVMFVQKEQHIKKKKKKLLITICTFLALIKCPEHSVLRFIVKIFKKTKLTLA